MHYFSLVLFVIDHRRRKGGYRGAQAPPNILQGSRAPQFLYGFDRAHSISSTPKEWPRNVDNRQSNAASSIQNQSYVSMNT